MIMKKCLQDGFLMHTSVCFSHDSIAVRACDEHMISNAMIFGALGVGKWRV
jgi:hypothetical protein